MEVVGTGSIHIFGPIDECPHKPDAEPLWQESVVIYVFDVERKVYMFLRMSQEPNRGPGYTTVWLNVWTPEYQFKHTDDSVPLTPGDVGKNYMSSGGGLCRYAYEGKHEWSVNAEEAQVQISLEDYHPGFGYYDETAGFLISDVCPQHIEATGWATGSVTIKGKTYEISGQAWRDHSWGKRDWSGLLVHRFYPALFGREFNFFCVTLIGRNGTMGKFGTLIRGDTVQAANDFDVVAYIGEDGVSNVGGKVTLRVDGETHVLEFEPFGKSAVSHHQTLPCVDAVCKVTMGDMVGVGVSETSSRPQGGLNRPFIFPDSPGIIENGVFPIKS